MAMNDATRQYIAVHADADVRQLALRRCPADVDLPLALQQIAGRQRARLKLPEWARADGLMYPPQLNMEQCSSEVTARYKATLAERLMAEALATHPTTLADLTGGFGVDFAYMSQAFDSAVYVERDEQLCRIARHNFAQLGLQGATTICGDGVAYLEQVAGPLTMVFLDPARRDSHGQRTYALADCTPNVVPLCATLMQKAAFVVLKLSPMLDWCKAVADVGEQWVRQVHVVSVDNECKELLMVLGAGGGLRLTCANWEKGGWNLFEPLPGEVMSGPAVEVPRSGMYLYEPNASVMKAGCFGALARRFGLGQVAANSHLFVADRPVEGFPGRAFVVEQVSGLGKGELRRLASGLERANIAVRNFPMTVADLRRRLRLADGGDTYLFATTLADRSHVVLVCKKY